MQSNKLNLSDWITKRQMPLILLLLLVANLLFRCVFEIHQHPVPYYFDQLSINTHATLWYTYMLPSMSKAWGGTLSSLGIGVLPIFHHYIGNTISYLLLNLLFVMTVYILSWYAFRSKILTITVGVCAAFTTFNHHVYENGSLVAVYIPYIFCYFNLFALYKLFNDRLTKSCWWLLWLVSLLLLIASFEGWVDYYAIILLVSPANFYLAKIKNDRARIRRLVHILSILTLFFVLFVYIKIKYAYASKAGDEHDLIINYGLHHWWLMVDDFISNFFTFFYTTIITYLPQQLTFSNAYLNYGSATISSLQNGYDSSFTYLAAINALLLWRFYAGVFISIFVYYLWKVSKHLWNHFSKDYFFVFLFMMMVLFGAPAHLFVKFRAMHIVPWLPYQAFIGQIGLPLLIGYCLYMLHQSSKSKKLIWIITISIWCCIISSGFMKEHFYQVGGSYGALTLATSTK